MNCEELAQLIPDLVDGTLPAPLLAEAEAALPQCPDCQRELEIARQIRTLLVALQAEYVDLRIPEGFEARLLAKVNRQNIRLEFLDLSSKAFGMWLIELLNLLGGLLDPKAASNATRPQPAGG